LSHRLLLLTGREAIPCRRPLFDRPELRTIRHCPIIIRSPLVYPHCLFDRMGDVSLRLALAAGLSSARAGVAASVDAATANSDLEVGGVTVVCLWTRLFLGRANQEWTADRLMMCEWSNQYFCRLCYHNMETISHLLMEWAQVSSWVCNWKPVHPARPHPRE
jgi:hypothetical protein